MSAASFGTLLDLVSDGPPLGAVGLGVRRAIDPPDQPLIRLTLGAGGGDDGRDRAGPESDPGGRFLARPAPALASMGDGVALDAEEDQKTLRWTVFPTTAAALPGGAETLRDGGLDALVGSRDHQLHPAQTPPRQLAKELGPDRLGLGSACFQTRNLPPPVGVHPDGGDDGDGELAIVAPLVRATMAARPPRRT